MPGVRELQDPVDTLRGHIGPCGDYVTSFYPQSASRCSQLIFGGLIAHGAWATTLNTGDPPSRRNPGV